MLCWLLHMRVCKIDIDEGMSTVCVCVCACYMQYNLVIVRRVIFGAMGDTSYVYGNTACLLRKLFVVLLLSSIKY